MNYVLHPDGITCIGNADCTFSDGGSFQCSCRPGFDDISGDAMNCSGKEDDLCGVIGLSVYTFQMKVSLQNSGSYGYGYTC